MEEYDFDKNPRYIISKHSKRRDFFAGLTKLTADTLGSAPYYGTVEEHFYTFIPALKQDAATLLVVGLNIKETIYEEHYNIIFMEKWPQGVGVTFWRKLLLRHDLTDEMYTISGKIPKALPSFVKKAVYLTPPGERVYTSEVPAFLPVMLVAPPGTRAMPSMESFYAGSDVFVTAPSAFNIKGSPAWERILQFCRH